MIILAIFRVDIYVLYEYTNSFMQDYDNGYIICFIDESLVQRYGCFMQKYDRDIIALAQMEVLTFWLNFHHCLHKKLSNDNF